MINSRGISLVELLSVCATIGVFGVVVGFAYVGWMSSYKVEKQVKDIYADLMTTRLKAMQNNRVHFAEFRSSKTYQIVEDTNDNNAINAGNGDTVLTSSSRTVEYENNTNGGGFPVAIKFNTRGFMSPLRTIWITHEGDADLDCIVISMTRINVGKMTNGSCVQK